jgi:type IV fimbrial biogenesis protein FimT
MLRRERMGLRHQAGFTLVEMMTVMMIVAVMITIAAPSFMGLMARNTLTSKMNEMVGAIQAARSEAVTRNTTVTMCRRSPGADTCDTSGGWQNGWLVFVDPDNDHVVDAGEIILGNGAGVPGLSYIGALGTATYMTFRPDGTTGAAADQIMGICKGTLYKGELTVGVTGRPSAKKVDNVTGC